MRKILLPTVSLLLLSVCLSAQKKSLPVNERKYSINLPDYWGKGNKVWQVLIDKLPLVCEELKDKEVCGDDCNPKYTVELYLTEPGDYEYYNKVVNPAPYTNTRHLASTSVSANPLNRNTPYNPEREYYSRSGNTWKITTTYNFQAFLVLVDNNEKVLTKMVLIDTDELWQIARTVNLSGEFNAHAPSRYIEDNKEKVTPTLFDLFAIVEEKIMAL
ncbi:MAG TPA: hypothetical protein VGO58_14840 [Chitinophagaceae bacterium]|jgi:hypothetical protein|nr:hypothetical protein [Chitinophagaceae bacterium]